MKENYKISSVDSWLLRYLDDNVEFTIGNEGAFQMTKPGHAPNLIGVTLYENSIKIIRGKLSENRIEIDRIKEWLLAQGYPKIMTKEDEEAALKRLLGDE